jgi:chromate transporter
MIYFELFYVFFYIGLLTFGGGYAMIPLIEEEVSKRGWLVSETISDFIAISEGTPGPFAINIATFIGSQTSGFLGALCATLGVVLPSFIIILLVAMVMKRVLKNRFVQAGLKGVIPVVVSLISATAIVFFIKLVFFQGHSINSVDATFDRTSLAIFFIIGGFTILYKKHKKKSLSPIIILLIGALLGIIFFEFLNY